MDPLTHSLVGALAAKTFKASRRRFWIMAFLGEAPDLDVFFASLGPWAFWLQHRGFTHSLLGIAAQTMLYTWMFSRLDKGPFRQRAWQYSIPLIFHVLCDYLTSYGIPLFSPFAFQEFSGDLVPAVTLVPLAFMLIGFAHLKRTKADGWPAVKPLWAAWGIYLLLSLTGKAYAHHLAQPVEGPATIVSGLMNPFRWTLVVEKKPCCSYHSYRIDTLTGTKHDEMIITTSLEDETFRKSLESEGIRRFVETTRWPMARKVITPDGQAVEWGKMLFSSRGMVRGMWSVQVSTDGKLSNEQRTFDFWNPEIR